MLITITLELSITFDTFADVTYRCQHGYDSLPGAVSPLLLLPGDAETPPPHTFSSWDLFCIENRIGKVINQLALLSHHFCLSSTAAPYNMSVRGSRIYLQAEAVFSFLACLLPRGSSGACQHCFPTTTREWCSSSFMLFPPLFSQL